MRQQLLSWIHNGAIAPEQVARALEISGLYPDGERWRWFLDRLLLVMGVLALACAVIFFFAFNWDALGRTAQFALVQALLLAAVLAWWRLGPGTPAGQVALIAACLMLGGLLALFGQTYQTGADTWQLFATWAMLLLPWAVLGRLAPVWLLWLALLNLALSLYHQTFGGLLWLPFGREDELLWLLFGFNAAAWAIWEFLATRLAWLNRRWAVRLIALACGSSVTLLVLYTIFEPSHTGLLAWPVYALWLAALYFVYGQKRPDLFMLAGACLSIIVSSTAVLGNALLGGSGTPAALLFIALVVIAEAGAAALWLKRVHAEHTP